MAATDRKECSSCPQMKQENKVLRTSINDINRNYVEVVNENLALRRAIEDANRRLAEAGLRIVVWGVTESN